MLKVLESNNQYFSKKDFSKKDIDLVRLYVQETKKYPLLTREEEQKYGKHLQLYPEIMDILSVAKINNNVETVLNLDKILASITIEEEREYITNILTSYYNNYGNQESKSDKIMMYYLQEYNKLCKTLHHIPTPEELTSYFSNQSKEKIFTNFTNTPRLESKDLILKVSNYVRYMIAKNTMINCNLRLVTRIAEKYYQLIPIKKMSFADFVSEGTKGLMKAVEKFDINKGYKFSTYAIWWIRQSIIRGFHNQDKTIRIPVNQQDEYNRYINKVSRLKQEYGRELTEEEILENIDKIVKLPETSKVVSLDAPVIPNQSVEGDFDRELTLLDFIKNSTDTEKIVLSNLTKEQVRLALDSLSEFEREIIKLRFGFKDDNIKTLQEIGDMFGFTRERIRIKILVTALAFTPLKLIFIMALQLYFIFFIFIHIS